MRHSTKLFEFEKIAQHQLIAALKIACVSEAMPALYEGSVTVSGDVDDGLA
jgi:hypothetical protein